MFEIAQRYRRRDLHAQFGGQRQGGISTPQNHPLIFLITGESGTAYGYHDGWDGDTYRYFGEGQTGPMQFIRGNRAVRDHALDGRALHLFQDVKKGFLRYVGEMTCAGYELVENVKDVGGNPRQAIAFQLMPVQALADRDTGPVSEETASEDMWGRSLAELRERALEVPKQVSSREALVRVRNRSNALRTYVRCRADGICEGCDTPAPFTAADGLPYLESHHTRRVSDGGPDDPRWVIAVCPNCHRRAHCGEDAASFNEGLKARLATLEPAA